MNGREEDIRRIAYQTPFKAFRVRLANGESIEIDRTLRTAVAADRIVFGVNEDPVSGVAKRMRIVPLTQIASIEVK